MLKKTAYLVMFLCLWSCNESKTEDKSGEKLAALVQAIKFDEFCTYVKALALPDQGVIDDLVLLCQDNQPTPLVTELIGKAWQGDTPFSQYTLEKIEENDGERSTFLVGFATKIPKLTPEKIRDSDLNNVLLVNDQNEAYSIKTVKENETRGKDLNYLKITTRTDMVVYAPQSKEFPNSRRMEVNYYVLSTARDDLALRTEHLLDNEANPEYDWARSIVVIIGDPTNGGSYLITLLNYRTWNHGFHKINLRALDHATKHTAQITFNYLNDLSSKIGLAK